LIGLLQYLNLFSIFDGLLSNLMKRGGTGLTSESRGVSILSSEPSRAAFEIIFISLLIRYFFIVERKHIYFDAFVLVLLLFLIKSFTGVFLWCVFILLSYVRSLSKLLLLTFVFFMSTLTLMNGFNFVDFSGNRTLELSQRILETSSFKDIIYIILTQSGFRGVSIISAYVYGMSVFFGNGVGNWESSSLEALRYINADELDIGYFYYTCGQSICSVRPTSFMSSLVLDIGLVGLGLFLYNFYKAIHPKINDNNNVYFYFFIFCLLFNSTVGNPIPWICIALILGDSRNDED
ncbi:hypothetical protein, partial [Vibrio cholerae]